MKYETILSIIAITVLALPVSTAVSFTDTPNGDHEGYIGIEYEYNFETKNESNVRYSSQNLPSWLTLNQDTGVLTGEPDDEDLTGDSGTTINITAVNQSNNSDTASTQYDLIISSGLRLDEVEVNGDEVDDGDEADEAVEIDDEVEIIATVENVLEDIDEDYLLNDDEDIDLEDVVMETTADDLDPADNLEDEVDIDAGDEEELIVTFNMESGEFDVDDEPFTVELDFEGDDDNGNTHTIDTFEFDLELDVEDEDLRFETGAFGGIESKELACGQNTLSFDVNVQNVGSDDLDSPAIGFDSTDLGIDRVRTLDEIDTGDDEQITERFTIRDRPTPGEYFVDLIAYPDRSSDDRTDTNTVSVTVADCTRQPDQTDENENDNRDTDDGNDGEDDGSSIDVGRQPSQGQSGPVGEPVVIGSGSDNTITDREYVYILAGLVAVLIITTGWMLAKVLS